MPHPPTDILSFLVFLRPPNALYFEGRIALEPLCVPLIIWGIHDPLPGFCPTPGRRILPTRQVPLPNGGSLPSTAPRDALRGSKLAACLFVLRFTQGLLHLLPPRARLLFNRSTKLVETR